MILSRLIGRRKLASIYVEEIANRFLDRKLRGICSFGKINYADYSNRPEPGSTSYTFSVLTGANITDDDVEDSERVKLWKNNPGKAILAKIKAELKAKSVKFSSGWDYTTIRGKEVAICYVIVKGGTPLPETL